MQVSFGDLVDKLGITNQKIWALEVKVNEARIVNDSNTAGNCAWDIRDLNKERIALKNAINEYANCGFKEVKVNHASAAS